VLERHTVRWQRNTQTGEFGVVQQYFWLAEIASVGDLGFDFAYVLADRPGTINRIQGGCQLHSASFRRINLNYNATIQDYA